MYKGTTANSSHIWAKGSLNVQRGKGKIIKLLGNNNTNRTMIMTEIVMTMMIIIFTTSVGVMDEEVVVADKREVDTPSLIQDCR